MKKIALLGLGRMGQEVMNIAMKDERFKVVFAIDENKKESPDFPFAIISSEQLQEQLRINKPDVVIDFSVPAATMEIAPILLEHGVDIVICTTGFSKEQQEQLKEMSKDKKSALLLAPDITPGINLLTLFTQMASKVMEKYDIQILDYHFKNKHDSPSGTARKIATMLELEGRQPNAYGVRAGNITGKHTVLFAGEFDQIEISHSSYEISIFAQSALNAALMLEGKEGYLEMGDLLNIREVFESCIYK